VATVRFERRIAAPVDTVWSIFCDPASIVEWFPGVTSATVEGNVRVITLRSGIQMPEEILTIDPLIHRFQYRVTSPLYRMHLGTIDAIELGARDTLCVYSTTAEPHVMALVIGGGTFGALRQIEQMALARSSQGA
jgi:hypothetical protein